jgi:cellulose synthase/poly-beta-1,6-N-acetylglucosamine synthase-like glycosyltransferase
MTFAEAAAAASLLLLLHVYVGYPLLLAVLALTRPRLVRRREVTPQVSVLIPAHDEGAAIRDKILNTAASDYPAERMEILVLSDGSTDDTVEVARRTAAEVAASGASAPRVRVLDLPRLGKARTLDAGARAAEADILVFTDANVQLTPDALRRLIENFGDPAVGGACGEKRHSPAPGPTGRGEGFYWRYENLVKRLESRIGSTVAADGALHAVRAHLYVPIGNPASADDMAISMRVVLQGFRLVCDARAVAVEAAPDDTNGEFRRKVRITNHSMRALLALGHPLLTSGLYSFQLVSHKLFRHLSPLFLLVLLLASSAAAFAGSGPVVGLLLLGQVGFYGAAGVGHLLRGHPIASQGALAAAHHFALMQGAALVGLGTLVRGDRLVAWRPRGGLEAA